MQVDKAAPKRPALRYYGGKWRLAPWIINHFPIHRIYVEPFGGAASVLLQKPRSYAEIYNDLDREVVNVFSVLRDPATAVELEHLLRLTPFSRDDFNAAYELCDDPIEQARRTIFKSFAGYGSDSIHRRKASDSSFKFKEHSNMFTAPCGFNNRPSMHPAPTGFRCDAHRSGTMPAHDWANYPDHIYSFVERLQGVVIENRPAAKVIKCFDSKDTLFYVDPPYVKSSRRRKDHGYAHEMSDEDHEQLASQLHGVQGMVILSAYPCELYNRLFHDWRKYERKSTSQNGDPGKEVLWISLNVPEQQFQLFGDHQ